MKIGSFVQQPSGYKAFIPDPFPPEDLLSIPLDQKTSQLHTQAALRLGKLDGITQILPDLDFFILMYVRKEAALSSQIEGTKATMIDAIQAEAELTRGLPADVQDIQNYIEAMNYGLKRLQSLPLSLRLIREVHKILLAKTQDEHSSSPGEFRTTQNWIGGGSPATARFVPPPAHEMKKSLDDFEKFLHAPLSLSPLIKTALAHAQFETIHPFVDGNGRTGRLLTTFYLCQQEILERPVLYLSEYFRKHREGYFDLLHNYHHKGDVLPWIRFFLEGVATVSQEAINTSQRVTELHKEDMAKVQSLGRPAKTGMIVLQNLYRLPIVNVKKVEEWTKLARPNANKLVGKLVDIGILTQRNQHAEYGRIFEYKKYLSLFDRKKEKG